MESKELGMLLLEKLRCNNEDIAEEKKELCNGGEKKETEVRKDKSRKSEIHYVSCVAKGCSKLLHPDDAVLHGQICGAIFVDCQFCSQKEIKRQDLENHYNGGCTKAKQCNECGSFFNTTEQDSHNCISALKNQVSCLKTAMIVQNKEQVAEIKKRDIHIDFLRHEYATLSDRIRVIENIFRSIPNAISKHSHHTGKHGDHHGSHQVYSHDHIDLHYDSRHLKRTHINKSRKHSAVDEISDGIDEDEFYSLDGYSSEEEVLTTIKEQPEEIIKDIVCKNGFVLDSKLQQEKLDMYYDLCDESKWTKNCTANNSDVYLYDGPNNTSGIMVIGEFDYSVEELLYTVQSNDVFLKVNPMLEKIDLVEEVTESDIIFYLKIKKILLVASRDFVGITKRFTRSDGTQSIIVYSVDYPDWPIPNDGTIRGEMIIGGWNFIPLGPNKTKAYNFSVNDYKGNIPKFVINMGASSQATVFKNLRDLMKERKEKGELPGPAEFKEKYGFNLIDGIAEGYPKK